MATKKVSKQTEQVKVIRGKVIMPMDELSQYNVLFVDHNQEYFYLEEIKPGVYHLKPWTQEV
jgi:hypothetical protein